MDNGVFRSGIRKTSLPTLCDLITKQNLDALGIEGSGLPFFPGCCETILSGDSDWNGTTDDNVYEKIIGLFDKCMPNFLLIHFRGIDDIGHDLGQSSVKIEERSLKLMVI